MIDRAARRSGADPATLDLADGRVTSADGTVDLALAEVVGDDELRHELARLESAFRRDAGRDPDVATVEARRAELEDAAERAWRGFRAQLALETKRASQRRSRIIAPLLSLD